MKKEAKNKTRTKIEAYTSEYAMSAGDNAASRKAIDASLTTRAVTNEHSLREAMEKGLDEMTKPERRR